nr:LysM peptidoglycan-binding domain-containing protein [uncultured Butyrivibrio sp.]
MSSAMYAAASLYNDPRYFSKSEVRIRANRKRRQRIFRRQIIILFSIIAVILFTVLFLNNTISTDAQSDEYTPEFKYYTAVTIHAGDSLWSIASEHFNPDHYDDLGSYVGEICSINKLSNDSVINAGECIILPYYEAEYK